jgi:hypothetical protein
MIQWPKRSYRSWIWCWDLSILTFKSRDHHKFYVNLSALYQCLRHSTASTILSLRRFLWSVMRRVRTVDGGGVLVGVRGGDSISISLLSFGFRIRWAVMRCLALAELAVASKSACAPLLSHILQDQYVFNSWLFGEISIMCIPWSLTQEVISLALCN